MSLAPTFDPLEMQLNVGEGEAHVWIAPIPALPATEMLSLLSADEQERADKFKFDEFRWRFIRARAQLRALLARYLEDDPTEIIFAQGAEGKLKLEGSNLKFNLSHSGDLALIAVSPHEVGVDLEYVRPLAEQWEIARLFFTEQEAAELRALPEAEKTWAFYRCWTRKEALLKGWGCGITRHLKAFRVSMMENADPILEQCATKLRGAWTIHSLDVHPLYAAALAIDEFHATVQTFVLPGHLGSQGE